MSRKKKITILVTSLALISIMVIGGTLAYFTDQDSRQNVITLGKVDGTLTETGEEEREDGTTGKDYDEVDPGDSLKKDPTITLDAESHDAYARIKITYTGLTEKQIVDLEKLLELNAGWSKSADGYFYYNQILTQQNKITTIFNKVNIPTTWGNEMANKTFNMDVVAELIQADNFEPVKDEAGNITGWGNVNIEEFK